MCLGVLVAYELVRLIYAAGAKTRKSGFRAIVSTRFTGLRFQKLFELFVPAKSIHFTVQYVCLDAFF